MFSPEYEDCARVARQHGVLLREVYDAVRASYRPGGTTMSEDLEPRPPHWLMLALLGWFVHTVFSGGMLFRVTTAGPRYEQRYREHNLLPMATEGLLGKSRGRGAVASTSDVRRAHRREPGVHVWLARWERPAWKYWFWGVVVVLLLAWPLVELILYLPECCAKRCHADRARRWTTGLNRRSPAGGG
ncbi:MAG: hypothetical protein U0797_21550 [Gemmataceae bacterium]